MSAAPNYICELNALREDEVCFELWEGHMADRHSVCVQLLYNSLPYTRRSNLTLQNVDSKCVCFYK